MIFILVGLVRAADVDVSGVWLAKGVDRTVTLTLIVDGDAVTGTLEGVQEVMTVTGTLNSNTAEGTVTNSLGSAYFKFDFTTDQLTMTLANLDAAGKPDAATAVKFQLKRPEGPKVELGFQVAGFAAPSSDPLLGAWVLKTMRLEIRAAATKGKYEGRVLIGQLRASMTAKGTSSNLNGSFKSGKVTKSFNAKLGSDDRLAFALDGKTYLLSRVR